MELHIPDNYWLGDETLETRTPWLVPGAILDLDRWLKPTDVVLEFGSGGSTLFFADRCKEVISLELDEAYYARMNEILESEENDNVTLMHLHSEDEAQAIMKDLGAVGKVQVFLPDWTGNRDVGMLALSSILDTRCAVILDNYSSGDWYPETFETTLDAFLDRPLHVTTYDDEHWYGSGTRIYWSTMTE